MAAVVSATDTITTMSALTGYDGTVVETFAVPAVISVGANPQFNSKPMHVMRPNASLAADVRITRRAASGTLTTFLSPSTGADFVQYMLESAMGGVFGSAVVTGAMDSTTPGSITTAAVDFNDDLFEGDIIMVSNAAGVWQLTRITDIAGDGLSMALSPNLTTGASGVHTIKTARVTFGGNVRYWDLYQRLDSSYIGSKYSNVAFTEMTIKLGSEGVTVELSWVADSWTELDDSGDYPTYTAEPRFFGWIHADKLPTGVGTHAWVTRGDLTVTVSRGLQAFEATNSVTNQGVTITGDPSVMIKTSIARVAGDPDIRTTVGAETEFAFRSGLWLDAFEEIERPAMLFAISAARARFSNATQNDIAASSDNTVTLDVEVMPYQRDTATDYVRIYLFSSDLA